MFSDSTKCVVVVPNGYILRRSKVFIKERLCSNILRLYSTYPTDCEIAVLDMGYLFVASVSDLDFDNRFRKFCVNEKTGDLIWSESRVLREW